METLFVFLFALLSFTLAQEDNGLGSAPIPAVGVSGSHVVKVVAWNDLNRNGMMDEGEPPVPGMSASLYWDSHKLWADVPSTLIGTEVSDEKGWMLFDCLNNGKYALQIWGLPEGYEYTTPGQGYEQIDSDAVLIDASTGLAQTQSFTISGQARMTYHVGIGITELVYVGSLQGFVWNDANYNGVQETTETGAPGVPVTLLQGDAVVAQMDSDMDGLFWFEDLEPGIYQLHFDLGPLGSGFAFTQPFQGTVSSRDSDVYPESGKTGDFQVIRGIQLTDIDAGVIPSPGTLSGYYWLDQNRDGQQSAGEVGLAGLTVEIYTAAGQLAEMVTTDSQGRFSLEIDSIDYYVQAQYNAESMVPTQANVGSASTDSEIDENGRSQLLTVRPGQTTTVDGGFVPLRSTLHFTYWRDSDSDSVYNPFLGDSPLASQTVGLYAEDGALVAEGTTDGSGKAYFSDLTEGSYYFQVALPGQEWGFVDANAGDADSADSDITTVNGLTGRTDAFEIGVGELMTDFGAGIERLYSSIRGNVFQDFNRNGLRDGADVGMAGVVIYLLDSEGILSSAETDAAGDYSFGRLDAATYGLQIAEESLEGYYQSEPNLGTNEAIDSDFPIGSPLTITLGYNEQFCCADAGLSSENILPASIEGFVWDDYVARSGIQTGNDTPISGIQIIMRTSAGTTVTTSTSNSQGIFRFLEIPPGRYELVAAISVHTLSPAKAGTDPALDSDFSGFGTTGIFEIFEGQTITNIDLGLIPKDGVVSGRAWYDQNSDGLNRGESAINNIAVTLYPVANGARGEAVRTVATTQSGSYTFTGVRPGAYQVFFTLPGSSWKFTSKNVGNDRTIDSDVNPDTGYTDTITVNPQLTTGNIDCGLRLSS